MKKMRFTIEWGCWHGYFAKEYLQEMDFGGSVAIKGGKLLGVEKVIFKLDDWGPHVFSRRYEKLPSDTWESFVHNGMDGIRIEAEADERSVIVIDTNIKRTEFNVGELLEKRHLVINPAGKYSCAVIHAEIDDGERYWFSPKTEENQTLISYPAFCAGAAPVSLFSVTGCMVACGEKARAEFDFGKKEAADENGRIGTRLRIRYLICASAAEEKTLRAIARFKVLINGADVWQNRKFGMWHDVSDQLLEEVWADIEGSVLTDGKNTVEVINGDENANVLLQNILIEQSEAAHMGIAAAPGWVLARQPFSVTINSNFTSALISIKYDEEIFSETINGLVEETCPRLKTPGTLTVHEEDERLLAVGEGEHEFFFVAKKAAKCTEIEFTDVWRKISGKAKISEVWELGQEPVPVKAGFEVRTGSPYEYIGIIKDAYRNQLGNLAVFRDYHNLPGDPSTLWDAAEYCRKHRIYTDAICVDEQTTIARASGEFCQSLGSHEFTGLFYGRFRPQNIASSLRDSAQMAVGQLALACETYRYKDVPAATGDASGGARYAYMAGFDILRHETFVGHHTLILTGARGSARAFGKNCWGVHIASQHNAHPELEMGIRRLWLGMFMPWVCGCSFAYEEDSLYQLFKYIRNSGRDYMTKAKYEITKRFYKYVSTHPREGECRVDIAVLQGRYAPPFTGISSANDGKDNPFSNENYPVFGHTGREAREWGFRQPEKGFHLLEILAPGIFLTPLHQKKDRVRKFFSGSPHGEFDQLPVEAPAEVFGKYKLIALLSWHTMEYTVKEEVRRDKDKPNDYAKFVEYARNGGTLFMAVPHLTTRADRALLKDMDNLKLYMDGDAGELCGVKICGRLSAEFCGEAVLDAACGGFDYDKAGSIDSIRLPNSSEGEDGPCMLADVELCGAETVLSDKKSGLPLLVRNKIGGGYVYLLTTYAYPGHEALKDIMPKILLTLIGQAESTRTINVTGKTDEVYWSNWEKDGASGRVYILNTDWTKPGGEIPATVEMGGIKLSCPAKEGAVVQVVYFKGGLMRSLSEGDYISIPEKTGDGYEFQIQCAKSTVLRISAGCAYGIYVDGKKAAKTRKNEETLVEIPEISDTMAHNIFLKQA